MSVYCVQCKVSPKNQTIIYMQYLQKMLLNVNILIDLKKLVNNSESYLLTAYRPAS